MKRFALGFVVLALTVTSSVASAQIQNEDWLDKNMGFGIGASGGVIGSTGLSLRFFPVEVFGLELVLGGARDRTTTTTPAQSATVPETKTFTRTSNFDTSLYGDFRFLRSNRSALSAYLGLGISMIGEGRSFPSQVVPGQFVDGSDSVIDFAFEIGLRGEIFLYKYFSVHGRVGINMNPHTDNEAPNVTDPQSPEPANPLAPSIGGMKVSIFDAGDLFGQFGFTLWFN